MFNFKGGCKILRRKVAYDKGEEINLRREDYKRLDVRSAFLELNFSYRRWEAADRVFGGEGWGVGVLGINSRL